MKSISQWQKALKKGVDHRFPKSGWGAVERIASIQRQLDDVKVALEVARGERTSDDHAHQDPDHRIAALVAEIFILSEERGEDVEVELEKVLAWFERRN